MNSIEVRVGDRVVAARVDSGAQVGIADTSFVVTKVGRGLYRVETGDQHWTVAVAGPAESRWVWVDGQVTVVEVGSSRGTARQRSASHGELASPMPATVLRVLVGEGDTVSRGDTLVVLEAMKMELPIRSPRDGVVRTLHCSVGELVQPGVNLLDLA